MDNPIEKGVEFVKSNPLKALALAGVGVVSFLMIGRGGENAGGVATSYTLVGSANIAPEAQLQSATEITLARIAAGAQLQSQSMEKDITLATLTASERLGLAEIAGDVTKTTAQIDAAKTVELYKTSTAASMLEKTLYYEDKADERLNETTRSIATQEYETARVLGTQDYEKTKLILQVGGKKAAKAMAGAPIDNRTGLEKFGSGLGSVAGGVANLGGVLKGLF